MTNTAKFSRILAGDIGRGDLIARAKTQPFHTVTDVQRSDSTVWLTLDGAGRIRPRLTAKLWRQHVPVAGD